MKTRLLKTLTNARRTPHRYFGLLLLLAGGFFFFFGETITRVLINLPSNKVFDSELSFVYKPNTRILHTKEGFVESHVGSTGLVDARQLTATDPARVMVLGDSYTEGLEVSLEKRFASIVDREMEGVAIVNAGRRGLHPVHYPIIADRHETDIAPNAYLVILHVGDPSEIIKDRRQVVVSYDSAGSLADITVRANSTDHLRNYVEPIVSRSAFATLLLERGKPIIMASIANTRALVSRFNGLFRASELEQVTQQIDPVVPKLGKKVFTAEEKQFSHDVLFSVLSKLSSTKQVFVAYLPGVEYRGLDMVEGEPSIVAGLEIKRVVEELHLPYVNLFDDMYEHWQKMNYPLHGFLNSRLYAGHLNEVGHASVAQGILNGFSNKLSGLAVTREPSASVFLK